MEGNLNFIGKWKKTSNFSQMEDDINFYGKWKSTATFQVNGKQPQISRQTKDILIF